MKVAARPVVPEGARTGLVAARSFGSVVTVLLLASVALAACSASGSGDDGALKTRLQGAVDDLLSSHRVPGASVAVIRDGALVQVVSGVSDLDTGLAVNADTQFRVASVTKMYLASIALRLVERGELSLDRPLGLGGWELPERLEFVRRVTLRQLLSHTSGLAQTFTRDEDRHRALDLTDLINRIPVPVCEPSKCWSYADGNYVFVQASLEDVTGRSLGELFRDELLGPLDLDHTALVEADKDDTPLPAQYALVHDEHGHVEEPLRPFEQALPRTATLVTTAGDAATFAQALFSGDLLEQATRREMLDTGAMRDLPCVDQCPFEYGLGVFYFNDIEGHDLIGHDGGSGAVVAYDRSHGMSLAILTNGGEQDLRAFLATILRAVDEVG